MSNDKILNEINVYLTSCFPNAIEKVILFGSRVEGIARDYSDYDILILLKEDYDWHKKDKILEAVCELNIKHDIIIDAHIISINELGTIRGKQPFIQQAIETGISA